MDLDEILNVDDDIEGDFNPFFCPVASTIPKCSAFKILRWM
jgi:hypothetical protein